MTIIKPYVITYCFLDLLRCSSFSIVISNHMLWHSRIKT